METEQQDKRRKVGGQCCIVPGCKNEFRDVKAKGKAIHFHKLPLKRSALLQRWLAALKIKSLPINSKSRICSQHFLEGDYITEKTLESDKLVVRRTNKLRDDVIPSVFNLTTSDSCTTHRRRKRPLKRATQAGKTQVGLYSDAAKDGNDNLPYPEKILKSICSCYGVRVGVRFYLRDSNKNCKKWI